MAWAVTRLNLHAICVWRCAPLASANKSGNAHVCLLQQCSRLCCESVARAVDTTSSDLRFSNGSPGPDSEGIFEALQEHPTARPVFLISGLPVFERSWGSANFISIGSKRRNGPPMTLMPRYHWRSILSVCLRAGRQASWWKRAARRAKNLHAICPLATSPPGSRL